jgi:predicted nucleic acid-binding protein
VAILNPRDSLHSIAESIARNCGDAVTTEFILIEVANILARSGDKTAFVNFVNRLETDKQTKIIPATKVWFDLGLELYSSHMDKKWSLTDCISFQVMRSHSLTEALTADHHFEQAGYKTLLKSTADG